MKNIKVLLLLLLISALLFSSFSTEAQGINISTGGKISANGASNIVIINGALINNGTYTKGSETLTFSGTTAKTISGSSNIEINNLVISNTGGITTQIALLTANNLTVASESKFSIDPAKDVTISGTAALNGTKCLIIKSDATGSGSFIDNEISGSGTAIFEKYLAASNSFGWNVSAPIIEADSIVFDGSLGAYFYNPTAPGWRLNDSIKLKEMLGYITRFSSNKILEFDNNIFNSGTKIFTELYRTGYATGNMGWNFIGNPYPSAINWDEVVVLNGDADFTADTKLKNAIHVSDSAGGFHAYVDGEDAEGVFDGIIPSATAFWVQVYAGVGNNENIHPTNPTAGPLTLDNTVRVHSETGGSKKSITTNLLRLSLSNSNYSNSTVVRLRNGATLGFDPAYDATKMFSQNPAYPQIYSVLDNDEKMAINAIPDNLSQTMLIPLGYKNEQGNTLTFTANNLSSFDANVSIFLEDKLNVVMQDLRINDTYTFTPNATQDEDRFVLHLAPFNASIDNKSNTSANFTNIYTCDNALFVNFNGEKGIVKVYNILGQELSITEIGSGLSKINMHLPTGTYIVNVIWDKEIKTEKVFLKF